MKKIYSLLILSFIYGSLGAQPYVYTFNNTLTGNGGSPTLTEGFTCGGTAGSFSSQAISLSSGACGTRPVFNFTAGGGLVFDNTGGKIGGTYTIHVLFKFSDYSPYGRLINFSNTTNADYGIYVHANNVALYPPAESISNCFNNAGIFYLLSIVRDGATNQIDIYVDGVNQLSTIDGSLIGVPATANTPIQFFIDDGCDVQPGSIKYLYLSPNTSTAPQVAAVFASMCSTVLPLNLINFSANKQNNVINLKWTTENEFNVSHFEIERSADGQTFSKLADVAPANSSSLHNYSFIDVQPMLGINFYRLKMIDIDGRFKYSGILKINSNGKQIFEVYPNPVKDVMIVNGVKAGDEIKLLNIDGKILSQKLSLGQSITIDVSKYPSGVYFVQYFDGEVLKNQKIIKQ